MNILIRGGLVLAAFTFSINTWATELNTDEQKLGYIIGMDIGKSLRQQGTTVDLDALIDAISATYKGEDLAMTDEEAATIRQEYVQKRQETQQAESDAVGVDNLAEGQRFLADNKSKEGVQTTDSGLQYKVLTEGEGPLEARFRAGRSSIPRSTLCTSTSARFSMANMPMAPRWRCS